ncbi:MAG: molybdenum cofactor guanylyltransferase [bacterium]|nr:molybdenum cofactor guanylyltransferase [bacterium]
MTQGTIGPAPLLACVLIGGKSSRMGQPKHLLNQAGSSWLERIVRTLSPFVDEVFLAGNGQIPEALTRLNRLADVCGVQGPLAGILAALRLRPDALWLVFACDLPAVHAEAVQWLIAEARLGGLAILPCLDSGRRVEPLFAAYSGECLPHLGKLAASGNWRLNQMRQVEGVRTPQIPAQFRQAWNNINTPAQLQRYLDESGASPVSAPILAHKPGETSIAGFTSSPETC